MTDEHQPFYRPTTFINLLIAFVAKRNPFQHPLTEDQMKRWQQGSQEAYRRFVNKPERLDQIVQEPHWDLSSDPPPDNVWFGEAQFNDDATPRVVVYRNSLATKLWPVQVFEIAGQSGMDHLFGHLYGFYNGERYDEEAACRWQQ